jgi:hypothetical protein
MAKSDSMEALQTSKNICPHASHSQYHGHMAVHVVVPKGLEVFSAVLNHHFSATAIEAKAEALELGQKTHVTSFIVLCNIVFREDFNFALERVVFLVQVVPLDHAFFVCQLVDSSEDGGLI